MTANGVYGNHINNNSPPHHHHQPPSGIPNVSTTNMSQPPVTNSPTSSPSHQPNGIELTENFYINNRNKRKHNLKIQVQLNANGIYLRRETPDHDQITEQLIRMEDIIGSYCGGKVKKKTGGVLHSCKRKQEEDEEQHHSEGSTDSQRQSQQQQDISAYLYIYAYVRKEKPLRRMRTVRILRFRSFLTYEDNLKSAERWQRAIKINKGSDMHSLGRKPLLIFLNPKSGSGKGRVMFQKQVIPVLKEADIPYELMVTTHANFAREMVKKRQDLPQKYSGIVVASGDGLYFEVLNGIMERLDWRVLTRDLPLGIIPCGSGNGLAKSIAHCYNEPYEPKPIVNASLTCVSGKWAPLDVVRVELLTKEKQQQEMFSFLAIGWGLIADVDIESEKLRSIGAQRFTLWSIHRILNLRTYKGKLSYLPWKRTAQETVRGSLRHKVRKSGSTSVLRRFQDALNEDEAERPNNEGFADACDGENDDDNDFADIISQSTYSPDSWASAKSNVTAYYSIPGHSLRSNRSVATIQSRIEAANAEFNTTRPQSKIPAITEPPAADWICEEGEYVMVHAAYTTHLASDCYFVPDSKLNDGIIYLVVIRAGVGKSQLVQFLLNLSAGTHLAEAPTPHMQVIPVSAFRIEPDLSESGILTVDGEKVPYGNLQAEIFPGLIKTMVPNVPSPPAAAAATGNNGSE
ncbi:sphingosine kinase 2 [Musca domestica]|uniref:Sphingosine kinase 2 n=1 Tax=Musca domestica TaxID=7370 RepID=A0ABM3UWH1_MUSDO|nr:sphingosine kinase 2 [Musca domestica]